MFYFILFCLGFEKYVCTVAGVVGFAGTGGGDNDPQSATFTFARAAVGNHNIFVVLLLGNHNIFVVLLLGRAESNGWARIVRGTISSKKPKKKHVGMPVNPTPCPDPTSKLAQPVNCHPKTVMLAASMPLLRRNAERSTSAQPSSLG